MRNITAVLLMGLLSVGIAGAVPLAVNDLSLITLGNLVAGPMTDDFITPAISGGQDIGDLTNTVYFNDQSGLYTYVHDVDPGIPNISEFNTGFEVLGFNNVAGFSFADSGAAGGPGDGSGFSIDLDADGTIDYELDPNNAFWDTGENIRFFYQSTLPAGSGLYNLTNGSVGTGTSFAPAVPEPSTYLLFGSALALFAMRRRKKSA